MWLREDIKTEHGIARDVEIAHCDYCGERRIVSAFSRPDSSAPWLEIRRADAEVPPIHACSWPHLIRLVERLRAAGVQEFTKEHFESIKSIASLAGTEDDDEVVVKNVIASFLKKVMADLGVK